MGPYFSQRAGLGFSPDSLDVLNSVLIRSLGHWGISGYPNWMSTQLDHRVHSPNYWVWCLLSLIGMSNWEGWDSDYSSLSKTILDNFILLFHDLFLDGEETYSLSSMYPVKRYESGSLNRHPDSALAMFAGYAAMTGDLDAGAVRAIEEPRVWGWESYARNLYVSTQDYSAISGNQILRAYYEDRGDLTTLYHGNGLLLSPAYVQETDRAVQWAMMVVSPNQPPFGSILNTARAKPESVAVRVDDVELHAASYEPLESNMAFDVIEKRSSWLEGKATMDLSFHQACIQRTFSLSAGVVGSDGFIRATFPSRDTVKGITICRGPEEPEEEIATAGVPWEDVWYIHFDYGDYGYIVVQASPDRLPGLLTIRQSTPWEWDNGRGPCAVVEIPVAANDGDLIVSHVIAFTNGTQDGAIAAARRAASF